MRQRGIMSRSHLYRRDVLTALGIAGAGTLQLGTAAGRATEQDQYVVGTAPGAAGVARRQADGVSRELDFGDIGHAVVGRFPAQARRDLRRNPNVRYVETDGRMTAIGLDSSDSEVPWGIDRVDAERVHSDGEAGAGADVAIVDTGIDADHPDLQANLGTGRAVVSTTDSSAPAWDDDNGHGTHCAGIADAADNDTGVVGVSTAATLHAVKVLDTDGSGYYSDVAAGLEWVADQGYDVASLSIGGPTSQTIADACRYASDRGVLVVAAAGNDSEDVEQTAPATYETVMAVSATRKDDSLASFSNYGTDIEIAAPGVDIESTYNDGGYRTLSGTSMACPHVSGAAGQLSAAGYTASEARSQLAATAEDVGLSPDEQGAGLLDVEAALGSTSDNDAPTVSWVTPGGGDTVAGTRAVQIDAGDAEDSDDSLDVTYTVDGGSSRTTSYNSTSGYYEAKWDTTGVSDGGHTLKATAMDSGGASSSVTIDVTVENIDDTDTAPTVDDVTLTDDSNPAWTRTDVDWTVSDADGTLDRVVTTLLDSSENVLDTDEGQASGSRDTGTHYVETKGDASRITVTVSDDGGTTDSASKPI